MATTVHKTSSWKESRRLLRGTAFADVGQCFGFWIARKSTVVPICRWWLQVLAVERVRYCWREGYLLRAVKSLFCAREEGLLSLLRPRFRRRCDSRVSQFILQIDARSDAQFAVQNCDDMRPYFCHKTGIRGRFRYLNLPVPCLSVSWLERSSFQVRLCSGCGCLLHPISYVTWWLKEMSLNCKNIVWTETGGRNLMA